MNYNHVNKELFSFLDRSPNAFFAIKNMCDVLSKAGMTRFPDPEGGLHRISDNGQSL